MWSLTIRFHSWLKDAIVSVEDQNFYTHWGIDIYGIARAALKDLMAGRFVEGGSTLTQQLSKNLFLTPERHFRRKIQEAMLAIQIERYYTKPQILTMYVNQLFMGHGQYGFAAAADFYFGKPLKDLNIDEAAMLAALAAVANQLFADCPSRPRADASQLRDRSHGCGKENHRCSRRRSETASDQDCAKNNGRTNWRHISWKNSGGTSKRSTAHPPCTKAA